MPQKIGRALSFAILLWMLGFVWGSIVFMVPSLKAAPPIPLVSSNPWISFPILFVWLPVSYVLARSYLRSAQSPRTEGLKLGLLFSLTNAVRSSPACFGRPPRLRSALLSGHRLDRIHRRIL